jgi:hypothetical protein
MLEPDFRGEFKAVSEGLAPSGMIYINVQRDYEN